MTLTSSNRWAASAACAAGAFIIFNPLVFWLMDSIFMGRGIIAENKGRMPSNWGLLLHSIVLFFVIYGLLSINWSCE